MEEVSCDNVESFPPSAPTFSEEPSCNGNSTSVSSSSTNVRRRCWDEAFASSESDERATPTPEPDNGLPMENVEEVDMCSSTTDGKSKSTEEEKTTIICEAHPGCFKTFSSVREYEDHYNMRHRHKCITCKKSLPSAHILELHVLETHDTLFSLMAERKPMLACFLESCSSTFWKLEERKEHCLSEHKFPKSFKLWDLASNHSGNKQEKSGKSKGKNTNKQKNKTQSTSKNDANSKDKMQIDGSSPSNEVSSSSDAPVPSTPSLPPNETMEMDCPSIIEKKAQQKSSKSKPKGKAENHHQKSNPVPITFGHSASRAFKPNYSFGLAKPVPEVEGIASTASKMDLDLSDIKEVLANTVSKGDS